MSPYDETDPASGELPPLQVTRDKGGQHLLHNPRRSGETEEVQGMLFQVRDDSINGGDT